MRNPTDSLRQLELCRAHSYPARSAILCNIATWAKLFYDLTTLFNTELEHAQLHQHTKRVGVVDKPQAYRTENARFVALVSLFEQFEARTNQFFTDIYRLVVLTTRTDA